VEQCPRLKRLLEATHLELNEKVFINTQRAPTWRANCRRFGPTGTVNRLVNLLLRVSAQMGGCKMEHKREMWLVLSRTGVLVVGVTSVARQRGREREGAGQRWRCCHVYPRLRVVCCVFHHMPSEGPGHPLL
jgi:hypothetical protein